MNVQKALICLPDISGFTRFMSDTDLALSHKVIPALLNEIIYANTIGLKVSEIEGDAVLFYALGDPPPFKDLVFQCQVFYQQFYQKIADLLIKYQRNEDSENIVEMLGLKIVLHYGDIGLNKIGKRIKLIGEDVIIAHRLLKNSISANEYVLFSKQLMDKYQERMADDTFQKSIAGIPLKPGKDNYDHLGDLHYQYLLIRQLA